MRPGERRTAEITSIGKRRAKLSLPKRWSHQGDLSVLMGKPIALERVGGGVTEGLLLEADAYSLQVFVRNEAGVGTVWVIFKHDIRSFTKSANPNVTAIAAVA